VLRDGWRLSGILAKANFNPGEPRVPAGNGRDSGRWTRNGAAGDEPFRIAEIGRRNGGGSSKPHGAVVQEAGDGVRFWAPPDADFNKVFRYGQSLRGKPLPTQIEGIGAAIGQGGFFDFQRIGGRFEGAYTDAANYGVGVLMNGVGYSWDMTNLIGNSYALLYSKPKFSPRRTQWWKRGYDDAASGRIAQPPLYK
jgi:hypothetical protein